MKDLVIVNARRFVESSRRYEGWIMKIVSLIKVFGGRNIGLGIVLHP